MIAILRRSRSIFCTLGALATLAYGAPASAQAPDRNIMRVDLPIGRSFPIETTVPVTRVSVANPDIADVAVIGARDVVINAKAAGETDVIIWGADVPRRHYRVLVHSPADRQQIVLYVKIAEVRRDFLRQIGVSGLYRDQHTRVGSNVFRTDDAINRTTGDITLGADTHFGSVLTDFGTDRLLAFLDAEEQNGLARTLAEPNIMAANKEEASFLAGGELPIPVVQGGGTGGNNVSITYREFGIRLAFVAEIVSDSLVKLKVRPEVSSLDYGNAITLSGFRIPALRTRRVESTIDVRRDQSLVISGLFDDERERVKTGIPLLMNLPILGQLFSSTRWQQNKSELLVVVTPVVVDPMRPRTADVLPIVPDTTRPAHDAIQPRLPEGSRSKPPR